MKTFLDLKKNIKKENKNFPVKRIALLGDTPTQLLLQSLKGVAFEFGFKLEVYEADYNQIDRQIEDLTSDLYQFKPEYIIIFQSSKKILYKYNKKPLESNVKLADERLEVVANYIAILQSNLTSKIIYYNYPEIDDTVFGSFSNKIENSFTYQIRKLNFGLMQLAIKNPNFFICDLSTGYKTKCPKRYY